jgi:ubiquinone/menaquinone biosynthesis C-methylase UbiE
MEDMLMNWPERVWIYSPLRVLFQLRQARKWIDIAGSKPPRKALEIGCGLGKGARIIVDKLGAQWVAAFDLEEKLVFRSLNSRPERFRSRIDFLVGDAQSLPFPDGSFDAVVNYGIIHHVNDWKSCVREISRTLKKEGLFYFEEIYPALYANFLMRHIVKHPTENRFTPEQFLESLSENGLELMERTDTSSRFAIVGVAIKQ